MIIVAAMEKPVQNRQLLSVMRLDAEQRVLVLIIALIALVSLGIGMMLPLTFPGLFS